MTATMQLQQQRQHQHQQQQQLQYRQEQQQNQQQMQQQYFYSCAQQQHQQQLLQPYFISQPLSTLGGAAAPQSSSCAASYRNQLHPAAGASLFLPQTTYPSQPQHVEMKQPLVYDEKVHIMRDGRYIPDEVLGSGTYGQVVRCVDQQRGTHVAIKIAHRELAYRKSALTEGQTLNALSGCNDVVRILDMFEDNDRVCIATELLYKNLYEVQRARSFETIQLRDLRSIASVILRALSSLHSLGGIHCDVKPENVMLRKNDFREVCLIDFGAVRQTHENQYYDVQSLWYRAPEVLCGVPYTHKIDTWGVGCLLYELHAGAPLVPGDHAGDQLDRIISLLGAPPVEHLMGGVNMMKYKLSSFTSCATPETLHQMFRRSVRACSSEEEAHLFADLLRAMLSPNPATRISCTEALAHPFFHMSAPTTPPAPLHTSTVQRMAASPPNFGVSPSENPGSFNSAAHMAQHIYQSGVPVMSAMGGHHAHSCGDAAMGMGCMQQAQQLMHGGSTPMMMTPSGHGGAFSGPAPASMYVLGDSPPGGTYGLSSSATNYPLHQAGGNVAASSPVFSGFRSTQQGATPASGPTGVHHQFAPSHQQSAATHHAFPNLWLGTTYPMQPAAPSAASTPSSGTSVTPPNSTHGSSHSRWTPTLVSREITV